MSSGWQQGRRYRPGDEHDLELIDYRYMDRWRWAGEWLERYFRYELHGLERVPDGGGLIIAPHAATVYDAILLCKRIFDHTGRVPRGLTDHTMFKIPRVRELLLRVGVVDGNRDNAHRLLTRGELCICMPGGGDEAFKSSARRYQLMWDGHDGFVRVAMRAQVPLIPTVCIGSEDSSWMPINALDWGRRVLGQRLPIMPPIGLGPLPLPVKYTAYVAEPVIFEHGPESADDDEVVTHYHQRAVAAIEQLIKDGLARRRSLWA